MLRRREWLKGVLSFAPAGVLLADSWPQFRGPGSRGIAADDPRLPLTWSNKDNVAWRVEIPGRGWSSPVTWDDQIFLHTNINNAGDAPPNSGFFGGSKQYYAPSEEHRWVVYSIDFKNGKTRWATEVFKGVPKSPRHPKNSYASETPVTDGAHVYSHFGDLGTYCLDMAGKIVWSKEWPPLETSWGYGGASSPALHEGRLYIVNDNEQHSYIVALDKLTGKEIWRADRDEPTTWSTPYIWKNDKRTEIITAGRNKIRSYDLDGKLLWELSGMSSLTIPTPFSDGGLLYVASGYRGDQVRPAYAIRPGAAGDITLKGGKTNNEYVAWSWPQAGPYMPSPVVYDGRYYTLLDAGFLTCHDAKTGEEIYGRQRIDPMSPNFTSSPWAYDGRIFCLNEEGDTYVIQAGPQYKLLGKNSMEEYCMASPAIVSGSLILRTFSKLYRIGTAAVACLLLTLAASNARAQNADKSLAENASFVNLNRADSEAKDWPPKGPVPKTADGKVDLSGAWAPNAIKENVDLLATGVEIPFQPAAVKLYNEHKATNSRDDPEARCLPPGVPRMSTTPYPFKIVQTPSLIVIVYEGGAHVWRQIFMDGRPHPKDPNPSWLGDSIGRWDGDTLVIDTVGLNGETWIDQAGLPTSDALHVTERIRRLDYGHLEIEHTVDDPKMYAKPWKFTTHPSMLQGELIEYICQEGERYVRHLVGK